MKKSHTLIAVVAILIVVNVLLISSSNFSPNPQKNIIIEPIKVDEIEQKTISSNADLRKLELQVEGMVCPVCAKTIKSSLLKNTGVLAVSISFEEGKADIYYDSNQISSDKILNDPVFGGFYTAKQIDEESTDKETVLSFVEETSGIDDPNYLVAIGKLAQANDLVGFIETADSSNLQNLVDEYVATLDNLVPAANNIKNEKTQFKFKQDVVLSTSNQINQLSDSLPGDVKYSAKRKAEETRIKLSYNIIVKAKSQFLAAINRINEIDTLFKNEKNVDSLIEDYRKSLEDTLKTMKVAIKKGKAENGKLLEFVIADKRLVLFELPEHKTILKTIKGEVPEDIKSVMDELEKISTKETNILTFKGIEPKDQAIFLNWIKDKGWYSHTITNVYPTEKLLEIRDGKENQFNVTFEFAELHLREHHPLGSYIDDMGIERFLEFAKENSLFQHEIKEVLPDKSRVAIIGDKGTEFEAEFELDFSTILSHMKFDHRWTNQNLLDAGYCEEAYPENTEPCDLWLTEYGSSL